MTSPFPGMDPYLENPVLWPDLHLTLIIAMRAELNSRLPPGYIAGADRHVWIEDDDSRTLVEPDLSISETRRSTAKRGGKLATAIKPRRVTLAVPDRHGKPYLKIVDAQDRRVVTVVELLSPSNKSAGPDRQAYLRKREEYLAGNVNFVEINLLRAGKPPPLDRKRTVRGSYYYLVCEASEAPRGRLWTFSVRDALPSLPIPLLGGDEIELDVRSCLDRAYVEGRYDEEIDYAEPPTPRLTNGDALWAQKLLAK